MYASEVSYARFEFQYLNTDETGRDHLVRYSWSRLKDFGSSREVYTTGEPTGSKGTFRLYLVAGGEGPDGAWRFWSGSNEGDDGVERDITLSLGRQP